jgi:cation diffusion facilitator family transporter
MSGHHHHHHGHDGTRSAVVATLAVNIGLTAAKWLAFAVTGSPSLFGEAAHSTADTMNPLVLWFGHRRSTRPSHPRHPHGHGREAFFWTLVAAIMMLAIGSVLTASHGIESLRTGKAPDRSPLALVIMALAFASESWSLLVVWRRLRAETRGKAGGIKGSRNPILLALLVENGADVLGVTLAFAGYGLFALTGDPRWDGAFSLAIAALLACSSLFLINRSRSLIIGESAPEETVNAIAKAASRPSVAQVVRVVAVMRSPHDVECRVTVFWDPGWFARRAMNGSGVSVTGLMEAMREETATIKADVRAAVHDVSHVDVDTE